MALIVLAAAGCERDARLTGHQLRRVEVKTVTDEGVELGPLPPGATPAVIDEAAKKTAFVLLRAIRADVLARGDRSTREQALDRQLDVCAPKQIFAKGGGKNDAPEETVYEVVRLWAPTLAYYVSNFEFDWPQAAQQLQSVHPLSGAKTSREVRMALVDPEASETRRIPPRYVRIDVCAESDYLRVWNVAFDHNAERQTSRVPATRLATTRPSATRPATMRSSTTQPAAPARPRGTQPATPPGR